MALTNENMAADGRTFIPTEDVIEELPDGRHIQRGVAGTPMPYGEAQRLGLLPSESKPARRPSETKAQATEAAPEATAPASTAPTGTSAADTASTPSAGSTAASTTATPDNGAGASTGTAGA